MHVYIVRSAEPGCEPTCAEWIAAQGRIDAGSIGKFKKVLKQLGKNKLPVFINSSGGTVDGGLAIGRLIRANGLDVAVSKTEFAVCAPNDPACRKAKSKGVMSGLPKSQLSKCASACVFVLAGGTRRLASERTFVGVHQFTSYRSKVLRTYRIEPPKLWGGPARPRKILISEKFISGKTVQTPAKDKVYENVRKYFAEMGVGDGVMRLLMSAPPNSIHWLTRAELVSTKLATEWIDAEQLITGVVLTEQTPPGDPPSVSLEADEGGNTEQAIGMPGYGLRMLPIGAVPPGATGSVSAPAEPSQ